jgi:uncharacterized protein (DUF2062 family)
MFSRVKKILLRLFKYETSPRKLAITCAVALYIAFTPFFGLHTLMLIGSGWLFNFNIPLLLIVGYVINNPFTMIPIYMSGYIAGHWVLHSYFNLNVFIYNPWWMQPINSFLHTNIGISNISFWAFLIGGNIIGIILAFLTYPLMHRIFKKLSIQRPAA